MRSRYLCPRPALAGRGLLGLSAKNDGLGALVECSCYEEAPHPSKLAGIFALPSPRESGERGTTTAAVLSDAVGFACPMSLARSFGLVLISCSVRGNSRPARCALRATSGAEAARVPDLP